MELDPIRVGKVARRWDDQHLELAAAGHQIGGAVATGFSAAVSGPARRFATGWGRTAVSMGDTCETRADSMRDSVRMALEADGIAGTALTLMLAAIAEKR